MELLYTDDRIVVCVKPAGVVSTDEPGGLPDLVRQALGDPNAVVRTVHRLDRVVSGVMVLARTARAASDLSAQIREGSFHKEYLAVVHGQPEDQATLRDLLFRDKEKRMTLVADAPGKDVREAVLDYRVLRRGTDMALVKVALHTGRTHQIRVQFSSRGFPLLGEKRYSDLDDGCDIALWSHRIELTHPRTGQRMVFQKEPPDVFPWTAL